HSSTLSNSNTKVRDRPILTETGTDWFVLERGARFDWINCGQEYLEFTYKYCSTFHHNVDLLLLQYFILIDTQPLLYASINFNHSFQHEVLRVLSDFSSPS